MHVDPNRDTGGGGGGGGSAVGGGRGALNQATTPRRNVSMAVGVGALNDAIRLDAALTACDPLTDFRGHSAVRRGTATFDIATKIIANARELTQQLGHQAEVKDDLWMLHGEGLTRLFGTVR